VCGGHPDDLIDETTALVVKNPGIPYSSPPVARAAALGIEIVTEVEVAAKLARAPIIGITGSNGKTTTTTLTGKLLEAAGLAPLVAGNIGVPLCDAVDRVGPEGWLVAELSSFQLMGTADFHPRIACLLNVFETHLDYHGTMEEYIAAKTKLFANQTADDTAVFNADDPVCVRLSATLKARKFPFSLTRRLDEGVYVDPPYPAANPSSPAEASLQEGPFRPGHPAPPAESSSERWIVARRDGIETRIAPVAELRVPGRHNVANALAAVAIALAAGAPPETLRAPLREFPGVEHRLEYVGTFRGVKYYNDSKATNPAATAMSIASLTGPIVLIAGGLDRGADFAELMPILRERVKGVVALGEVRHRLRRVAEAAGLKKIIVVEPEDEAAETLRRAVREAAGIAEAGDTVLLSPACASWDMFPSYEVRGRIFKESAHTL
jgi:UDP-N-acetylmuramoylalanine--D-glutamate ligase